MFTVTDAAAILATFVPQRLVGDRIAWSKSNDGLYNVKTGYQCWREKCSNLEPIPQFGGSKRIWKLLVPHKMKVFLWCFCRNNIPVRNRLRSKGVPVTIICPFFNIDVEHLLHVFFDCSFAASYWRYKGFQFDMSTVDSAPDWLLNKLDTADNDELVNICTILWGVWFWRNKKVWEDRGVSTATAMDGSFNSLREWRNARAVRSGNSNVVKVGLCCNDRC